MIILLSNYKSNKEINIIYNQQITQFKSKKHYCQNCKKITYFTELRSKPRKILAKEGVITFNIKKFKCSDCQCEHTILIDTMIPFCFYTIPDCINIIIQRSEGKTIPDILKEYQEFDENTINHILKKYKRDWQDKISIEDLKSKDIPRLSLEHYQKQFLQVDKKGNKVLIYDFAQEDWLYQEMSNKIEL